MIAALVCGAFSKTLTEEKAEDLRLDLEKQKNLANKNYEDNLSKQKQLTGEIKDLTKERHKSESEVALPHSRFCVALLSGLLFLL